MSNAFDWSRVADMLRQHASEQLEMQGRHSARLSTGQCASLRAIADRIEKNGLLIADEVGMGKTRIAVEVIRCVTECNGRVAILVPPGLGYQWQEELRNGHVRAPAILRSLWGYLSAWEAECSTKQRPWFDEPVVTISHAFANWRLGERTRSSWRWALLPELYASWHRRQRGRVPNGYPGNPALSHPWVRNAAASILADVSKEEKHEIRANLDQMLEMQWSSLRDAASYEKRGEARQWLERSVGFGLGKFDLIVIDEAHKSRGHESGLSRQLDNIVLKHPSSRTLAMTATPVELETAQWQQTLARIGLDEPHTEEIREAVAEYADAARELRLCWLSKPAARLRYKKAAAMFKAALSPYLLRRDKREDTAVQDFQKHSGLGIHDYRREFEIAVDPGDMAPKWQQAVCAAEALSVASTHNDDPVAKRLRLTLGNGHGIAALLDQLRADETDALPQGGIEGAVDITPPLEDGDYKRLERVRWWTDVIGQALSGEEEPLFNHPGILAAIHAIEQATAQGEKVLVFGRFTAPLRRLVQLLNAREMLRRLDPEQDVADRHWPQEKVHGEQASSSDKSDWPAIRAASRQLGIKIADVDDSLRKAYAKEQAIRADRRRNLIGKISQGLHEIHAPQRMFKMFFALTSAVAQQSDGTDSKQPLTVALIDRALHELIEPGPEAITPQRYAEAFCQLIDAASDQERVEETKEDDLCVATSWAALEEQLRADYKGQEGTFARLMFGGTAPAARRMLQLRFNRPHSFPRVLVAQSMVGREGLNLHQACRIVVLLHPEWNPGVVEQQIGRVDRIGSHWSRCLDKAVEQGVPPDQLPRIEVRPVVFRGTYDEHNWQVLRERWDDLRAQLHGIVVPPRLAGSDPESKSLIDQIERDAPNFSPAILRTAV